LDSDGDPTRARFKFDHNLDDRDVQTLSGGENGFE